MKLGFTKKTSYFHFLLPRRLLGCGSSEGGVLISLPGRRSWRWRPTKARSSYLGIRSVVPDGGSTRPLGMGDKGHSPLHGNRLVQVRLVAAVAAHHDGVCSRRDVGPAVALACWAIIVLLAIILSSPNSGHDNGCMRRVGA